MDIDKHQPIVDLPVHDGYDQDELKDFNVDASIPMRYRGTSADQRDMAVLGKKQVLRVRTASDDGDRNCA
jgi:hypothetical protein